MKVSISHGSHLAIFSSMKSSMSASRLQNVYCLRLSKAPSQKKKRYLQFNLTPIIHSNGKILFP